MRSGSAAAPQAAEAAISGFWRRIFALWIDALILGAIGFGIGRIWFAQLVALGTLGRLIGFPIALLYWTLLDSRLGGSATLGKRILGLRVVGRSGNGVSLFRALVRSAVLSLPYFLNGLIIPEGVLPARLEEAYGIGAIFIVFGGTLSILYLYIFNRRTRQSLHDLVAGTFVVNSTPAHAHVGPRIWPVHIAIAVLLLLSPIAMIAGLVSWLPATGLTQVFAPLEPIRARLAADPRFADVNVSVNTLFMSGQAPVTTLIVNVRLRKRTSDPASIENEVAAAVLAMRPDNLGKDRLSVGVVYGFDLGIWRENFTDGAVYTPAEWIRRLKGSGKTGEQA